MTGAKFEVKEVENEKALIVECDGIGFENVHNLNDKKNDSGKEEIMELYN